MNTIDIRIDEALWSTSMLPEGIIERWFVADGNPIVEGHKIAEVRIEGALHEVTAPASGQIFGMAAPNSVIEPGSLLAKLSVEAAA
jgi:pyruvate/2-oxoglutarate dehydrogenase complex dihydrolipoamide acyltransferase (E2) component